MLINNFDNRSDKEWDGFICSMPGGTPFHSSKWLRFLEKSQGNKCVRLGFFSKNRLVGVLPFFKKKFCLITIAASPFIVEDTPYMGFVIDDEFYDSALNSLNIYMKQNGVHFFRLIQKRSLVGKEVCSKIKCITRQTHIIDLSKGEDEIWNGMEGRCRTAIRKALNSGVSVSFEKDRESIENYYEMLRKVYISQSMVNVNNLQFYINLIEGDIGCEVELLTARLKDKIIAGAILVRGGGTAYYLNGASFREYNQYNPNNLIQWVAIKHSKEMGSIYYDFVGSDIERLAKFKKSFGGNIFNYNCVEITNSSIVQFARERYPEYKMLVGKIRSRIGV
jgi:lipid II:glycine glycyltransferase (peptidoglycan interpeptide bridge formation enzyme)